MYACECVQETWYPEDLAVSSFGSGATASELVTFGWIDGEALTARITIFNMVTGQLLTDITTVTNAKLQTMPTVRMDQDFAGVVVWGDSDDIPTIYLIRAGDSAPVFTYTTPGS